MNLPAPVQELWNVWREIEGKARHNVMVNLLGAAGDQRDAVRRLLLQQSGNAGALRVNELAEPTAEADIHLVLLDPSFGPTTSQLAVLRKIDPSQILVLLVGGDETLFDARRREVATAIGLRVDHVLAARTVADLRPALTRRMMAMDDEFTVPLARQFPLLREAAAEQEMQGTARQNALVGAIPVPGADMPIMTANQVKMVLRLAAIYDQPMTGERLKEVLAVVGGGFAMRTAARQVAKFIPGPGWIVGGALGYAGTLAMGKAAIEYFRRTTELPAPRPHAVRKDGEPPVIDTEATTVEAPDSTPH